MGYNGNASGLPNACDKTGADAVGSCGCVHSEANAIINCNAPRFQEKILFATDSPCPVCAKYILNLGGVTEVYYFREYRITDSLKMLKSQGVKLFNYQPPAPGQEDVFVPFCA
jgi:deoxycytidylate deaminase